MSELNWTTWSDKKVEKVGMEVSDIIEQLEKISDKLNKIGFKYLEASEDAKVEDNNIQALMKSVIERLYNEIEEPA